MNLVFTGVLAAIISITSQNIFSPSPTITAPYIEKNIPSTYEEYFDQYSALYKVDKNVLKNIATCESSINPNAVNGIYGGIYQFAPGTWIGTRERMNLDSDVSLRFNAEESIKTAAYKISQDGTGDWAGCL